VHGRTTAEEQRRDQIVQYLFDLGLTSTSAGSSLETAWTGADVQGGAPRKVRKVVGAEASSSSKSRPAQSDSLEEAQLAAAVAASRRDSGLVPESVLLDEADACRGAAEEADFAEGLRRSRADAGLGQVTLLLFSPCWTKARYSSTSQ
jgi:hypothetical protein